MTSNVCLRCAQIKHGCNGGIPCSRCQRLSLPCHPKLSGAATRQNNPRDAESTGGVPDKRQRARIQRVQTGCLTCKKRKKKCDERKPRCGDCGRLCLECTWPPGRDERLRARGTMGSRTRPWTMPDPGIDSSSSEPRSPSSSAETNIPFQSSFGLGMEGGEDQMQRRLSAADSDMDFDISLDDNVWDFSIGQQWMDIRSPTPSVPASPPDSLASASLSLYNPSLIPALQCPNDKALLNHYSTIVVSVLSRQADNNTNPFLSYIIPMTMSSELVLHCVLILSAKHWSRLQPQIGSRGAVYQSKATQSLANLLSHVDKSSVGIALLSCLLLCMVELLDGNSSKWKLHLEGAKRLVTTLKLEHHDSLTGHYKFLIKLSRFLDSAATTSTCKPPLIDDNREDTAELDPSSTTPDDDDRALYGIPKQLFHIVDEVNRLANKRSTRVDTSSEEAFRLEAATVEDWLNRWSFEYGGPSRAVKSLFPGSDDVIYATTAYEWALRLRLHQITEGYALTDATVTQAVEAIVNAVQKIRYGSPLEGCLLFPLVMAGGACDQLEHRVIIQDRLMVMERTCGFGYIYQARDLVERVWNRRDQVDGSGARINWARIRFAEMNGLVIF